MQRLAGNRRRRFAIKLANRLGFASVDALLDQMTPEEFDERWTADSLDPIDESWLQTGVIASAIVNAIHEIAAGLSGRSLQASDYRQPADYMPHVDVHVDVKEIKPKPANEMEARWQLLAKSRSTL